MAVGAFFTKYTRFLAAVYTGQGGLTEAVFPAGERNR
jgi:hypothetical protein